MKNNRVRKYPPGAGIVCFKQFEKTYKTLALKIKGKNDIPKGIIDKGENSLEAAIRETYEEAGLTIKDYEFLKEKGTEKLVKIMSSNGNITCYVAIVRKNSKPKIMMNPKHNIYEHESYEWLDKESMLKDCFPILSQIVEKAFSVVKLTPIKI